MGLRDGEHPIEPEVLAASDVVVDAPAELDLSVPLTRSGVYPRVPRAIDPEIAKLNGGIFAGLPAREIPLEAFHLDEPGEPPPLTGQGADSLAPIAPAGAPREPERSLTGARIFGYAVVAGMAALVTAAAVVRSTEATQTAAASAIAAEQAVVEAALAAEPIASRQDPAPADEPSASVQGAVPAAAPDPAPVPRPSPPPAAVVPDAPRTANHAGRAVPPSPTPAAAAAPAAADKADLPPLVIPPLPPKPEVAFDRAAAAVAIAGRGMRAASCLDAGAGSMAVPVRITFLPSGDVGGVTVTGGALLGTAEGACVATALRGAHVPPFDGEPVTVRTAVRLR